MNQVFPLNNDKSWKSVLVQNDRLLLINKSYSEPEEFIKGYDDDGLGRLLKKKQEITLFEISSISHAEKDNDLTVTTASSSTELEFANENDMQAVVNYISQQKKFNPSTETMSTFNAIKGPGLGLIISVFFGWVIYDEAKTLEAGGELDTTGRRALFKKIFAFLAETLGSTGTLIVAGLAAVVCLYFLYKRLKTPPNVVVYS